jgi:hypothetical protein
MRVNTFRPGKLYLEIPMKRERRYLIFKLTDILSALNEAERAVLSKLEVRTAEHRFKMGKKPLSGVFVEADWPECPRVWRMIEVRVAQEEAVKQCAKVGHDWQSHFVAGEGDTCRRCGEWQAETL